MTDQTPALDAALAAFQDEFLVVPLDGENPHFGSRYATLPTIVTKMTPVLRTHGLMFKSHTDFVDGANVLVVTLLHIESGETMLAWDLRNHTRMKANHPPRNSRLTTY